MSRFKIIALSGWKGSGKDHKILRYCVECCWRCNNAKSNNFTHEQWFKMTECFR